MLLSSVLSWRESQAWNPRQIQHNPFVNMLKRVGESYPAALSVLVFLVRKVRLLLNRAATDSVWPGCLLSCHSDSRARYNLREPIPLQVEHVAVEFVLEPFRPSGPNPRTMKTSTQ